jgi:branched-chain amino acid transport system substrate-binding protein
MKRRFVTKLLALAAVPLLAVACADGGGGGGAPDSIGDGDTIKVGLIYDVTGPAAAGSVGTDIGARARLEAINAAGGVNGHKLELVVGDSASSPAGAQAAAKTLVEQKGVFSVMMWTYVANAATPYLEQQGIPVIGGSWDFAPQWAKANNFFGTQPAGYESAVVTTYGDWFKNAGVKKAGTVGLNIAGAKDTVGKVAQSIESAGIPVPFENTTIEPTTADFGPAAIAIKESGIDGLYISLGPNGIYALSAALKQQNVNLKLVLAATGYGQSLLDNATARDASDGVQFISQTTPKELETEASKKFASELATQGFTGVPDFQVAGGYTMTDLFAYGLNLAGDSITRDSFIDNLRKDKGFNAGGLLAGTADFTTFTPAGPGLNFGNCMYVTELTGDKFTPQTQTPKCGNPVS